MCKGKFEEVEVRFLEVDVAALKGKLKKLDAVDKGEDLLKEIIFYDKDLYWKNEHKRVRMRERGGKVFVTFKHNEVLDSSRVKEVEFESNDWESTQKFLESVGLILARKQEKRRHTFLWNDITIDIDTWPGIPPYVELESDSEEKLKEMTTRLGFQWEQAVFRGAGYVLNHYYNVPIFDLQEFSFEKIL